MNNVRNKKGDMTTDPGKIWKIKENAMTNFMPMNLKTYTK